MIAAQKKIEFYELLLKYRNDVPSQLMQDLFAYFFSKRKKGGFFVEFGATNGFNLSNTFILERYHNWKGILAEPLPAWHDALRKNRSCSIDTRCVYSRTGEKISFRDTHEHPEYAGIESLLQHDGSINYRKKHNFIEVETVSLNDLLEEHHAPYAIDYLSLDTEGSEFEILNSFDFSKHDISIITVEHNFIKESRQKIKELLEKQGFIRVFENLSRWDDWYLHQSLPCHTDSISVDAFTVQKELVNSIQPTIFDIGAHIGTTSKVYRRQFPDAYIHCFEPFPQSFQSLSNFAETDKNIFCHEIACSDLNGTDMLNANALVETNSLLTTDYRGSSFWGENLLNTLSQIEVNTITIDTFCAENEIHYIDILKMDAQGAEFKILQGAQEMLSQQRISLIYTELIVCPTYQGQHKLHEYISFLASYGYEVLDFFNPVRKYNQLIQTDVIFVSASFREKKPEIVL